MHLAFTDFGIGVFFGVAIGLALAYALIKDDPALIRRRTDD